MEILLGKSYHFSQVSQLLDIFLTLGVRFPIICLALNTEEVLKKLVRLNCLTAHTVADKPRQVVLPFGDIRILVILLYQALFETGHQHSRILRYKPVVNVIEVLVFTTNTRFDVTLQDNIILQKD